MSWTSSHHGLCTCSLISIWLRWGSSSPTNYSLYGFFFLCWCRFILLCIFILKFIMRKLLILTRVIFLKIIKIWTFLHILFNKILTNGQVRLVIIFFFLLNSFDKDDFSFCLIFLFTCILRLKMFSHQILFLFLILLTLFLWIKL